MSALAKLWQWLQDRRRPAEDGIHPAPSIEPEQAVDSEGGAEKDLRAARRELLRHENWRHRAGPWQQK